MSSKALSRKTFGMSNMDWLGLCCSFTFVTKVPLLCIPFLEFVCLVLTDSTNNKEESTTFMINILHPIGFAVLLVPLSVMYLKWLQEKLKVTTYSPLIPVTHFFIVVFYMYNPWIIKYRNRAYLSDGIAISSFVVYVIAIVPSTCVLWRMSKVKPDYDGDEPYLVIYGGEESETKKLLDYSE
ncbi:unnamed protein product [Caenorhabditis brenneri]